MQDHEIVALIEHDNLAQAVYIPVTIVSVHDGDTFSANIAGWPAIIGQRMLIRLAGIDAPELHDKRPEMAALATVAHDALMQILSAGTITLTSIKKDKYFRLLCTVSAAGNDVAKQMIEQGLARPYNGHGIKPW